MNYSVLLPPFSYSFHIFFIFFSYSFSFSFPSLFILLFSKKIRFIISRYFWQKSPFSNLCAASHRPTPKMEVVICFLFVYIVFCLFSLCFVSFHCVLFVFILFCLFSSVFFLFFSSFFFLFLSLFGFLQPLVFYRTLISYLLDFFVKFWLFLVSKQLDAS